MMHDMVMSQAVRTYHAGRLESHMSCFIVNSHAAGGCHHLPLTELCLRLAEKYEEGAAPADSDCIEVLPPSAAPKLEGGIDSHPASNGHGFQHSSVKQEQHQQNMGPRSNVWSGAIHPKAEDSSAAEAPGFGAGYHLDAISAQPATLMKQLSKGRKASAGALKEEVQALLAMGFSEIQAMKALQNCSHDVQRAANWLLAGT